MIYVGLCIYDFEISVTFFVGYMGHILCALKCALGFGDFVIIDFFCYF